MQFLAAKRRRVSEEGKRCDELDVDNKAGPTMKQVYPQTITEITRQLLDELPVDGQA
jgi:hypothetical protein